MAQVRVVLGFVIAFALMGVLLVSWLGPGFIAWDNTVGVGGGQCICSETALLGAKFLIAYQMRGLAVGAILGLISGITFVVLRRKKAEPAAAA